MISIVTVYNNEGLLNRILVPSIKNQTAKYEFIPIDNTDGKFKSAAAALNYGAKQASGKYIMFVHQDVELDSPSWLETTENILIDMPDLGIAGVVGMSEKGKTKHERGRGYISDSGEIWKYSNAVQKPEEIQTLDECLLIIPKSVFNKLQFDEKTFDDWHCYGADYCLSVPRLGLKTYVIPAFIYHRSVRQNVHNLSKYKTRLYNKHKVKYKKIYTTTGEISLLRLKLRIIKEKLFPIYRMFFPGYIYYLNNALNDCKTVLDLGCGYDSPLQYYNASFTVGVELFDPYLQESIKKGLHSQYIKADIKSIEFMPKSFDAVIATEVLEHLTKDEGYALLSKMEQWARKKVIITTPNGYLKQDTYDDNALQEHKSGWTVKELNGLGFDIHGISGWRTLRSYKGSIKYKPVYFWMILSDLSQKLTYYCPKLSFQLLAIKYISEGNKYGYQ